MAKVTLWFALLLAVGLPAMPAAADGASSQSALSRAAELRLQTGRDHHQGRSVTSRRSDSHTPSYLRRTERAQSLRSQDGKR